MIIIVLCTFLPYKIMYNVHETDGKLQNERETKVEGDSITFDHISARLRW